jgi:chemotaxis regulatin CheY-phosphate phosphatase CheZ
LDTAHPQTAAVPAVLTRTWAKHDVLRSLDELRDVWRDYAELLSAGFETAQLNDEQRALIQFHGGQLQGGSSPREKMEDLVALLGDLLAVVRPDTLSFRVPTRSALLPEEQNPALNSLSQALHRLGEPLDSITNALVPAPTLANLAVRPAATDDGTAKSAEEMERSALLKAATVSLFKGVVRQDWADVSLVISHINLVTTSGKSRGVVREVAHIAREIYNSLNEFSQDLSYGGLTQATQEIPDAVVKLKAVIVQLEEFAHAGLGVLEQLTADALDDEQMIDQAGAALTACDGELAALLRTDAALQEEIAEVRAALAERLAQPLQQLKAARAQARDEYMTLISNMSFQDLSGQTLKKVISFIEDLQAKLMGLVARGHGAPARPAEPPAAVPMEGPDPAQGRAALSQGNVDKMLADLGF